MPILKNRAKMSTSTTGTGTITLGSAEAGYQTFADAGVANGDVVRYILEDSNNNFEIGTGTYSDSSGTTLSRTVSESSNSNNSINLSGSAVVFIGATAEDIQSIDPIDTTKFTATAGQTVFTGTWEADNISVFVNGVKLPDSDVTATDTQITISACLVGDIVEVVEYSTSAGGSGGSGSGVTVYASITAMTDVVSPSAGDLAYVTANTSLYQNNGNGWYRIATINTSPTITSVQDGSSGTTPFALAINGTATVITITAADVDPGTTLYYSYTVSSGSLTNGGGATAAVKDASNNTLAAGTNYTTNVFRIVPTTTEAYAGNFSLTFNVTDNINTAQSVNAFTLQFSLPYSLKSATYDNINQVIGSVNFKGFTWNANGTKLYTLQYSGTSSEKRIVEYGLSSAWDLTTTSSNGNFDYSSQDNWPFNIQWGDSGSKLYILGTDSNVIYQYNASTAYQITSGLSYSNSFSFSGQGSLRCFCFKPDGSKMFMADGFGVYEYTTSSNWSINNFSYTSNAAYPSGTTGVSTPLSIMFSPDGTILTVVASYRAVEIDLSTAWDKSTMSYTREFVHDASYGQAHYGGSAAGRKLYILRQISKSVAQYSVG